jgi:TonB family protein
MLGRTEKGPLWVMEHTPKGEVRVRSLALVTGETANAHSHILSGEQIQRGVQVKFKKKDSDEIKLEIRAMKELHPKWYRETGAHDFSKGFLVYHCVSDWSTEATRHKDLYTGALHGSEVFRVSASGKSAKIKSCRQGVVVEVNGTLHNLDAMPELELSATEFFKASVRFGAASWYFAAATDSSRSPLFEIPANPAENKEFFKYALGATLSLLLFIGGAALVPQPEKEEIIPPQVLKVLVKAPKPKKEKMPKAELDTNSPKHEVGEKVAEKQKPQEREQAVAKSEQVQPENKVHKVITPPGGGTPKQAARAPVVRPNRQSAVVQNLAKGLMRNGLTRILDPKMLDSAKLGNMGALATGKASAVAGALSNLAVDVNSVGKGVGEGKVAGFGGKDLAGVRGPAQIGYGDGTKGALSGSGNGGSPVSLGTEEAEVEEGLTKEEVGRVIHAHMKEVRYCYESSMVRASRVDGKVILDFTINGKGVVAKAKVSNSSLPDQALGECITRRLRTWQFPYPKGGVNVDVSYPFIFKTLGG